MEDVRDVDQGQRGVGATMRPATVEQCHQVIEDLVLQNTYLREQLAWMQERLKLDSHNSSKPPSSDGPGRGNRAQRRATQRKRGAQQGHRGTFRTLLPHSEVSGLHDCTPARQCECGGEVTVRGKPLRHQVFDLPPVRPDVQ